MPDPTIWRAISLNESPMNRKFLRSFANGFSGLAHAFGSEQNLRIHGVAAVCVIVAGFFFALAAWEWIAVLLCIGLVISAECMNSAVERIADRVSLERHPLIKQAKDCSAAAVLVLAMTSAVVGGIVFAPKISAWMGW
jgi:diacylglycerol kinase